MAIPLTRHWKKLPTILQQDKGSELMLLEYGGNDCDFDWHKVCENPELAHEPNVPFEKIQAEHNLYY